MSSPILPGDVREIIAGLGDLIHRFEGATVLISGGRGFLGKYLVGVLQSLPLRRPPKLIVLDNFITSDGGLHVGEVANTVFVKHNVSEPFKCDEPVDFIISAAGIASPYYYAKYPLETIDGIVLGTRHMLELARQHKAILLYTSTSEIYGDPTEVPTPETYRGNVDPLGKRSVYDEAKRLGETLCSTYTEHFGVKTRIVRPFNCVGPGLRKDDYRVMPNFIANVVAGKPLVVFEPGLQTRTFCYVTDLIEGVFRALLLGGDAQAYNLGNPQPEISMQYLAKVISGIAAKHGRTCPIERREKPGIYTDEPQRRCPDISKAKAQIGYSPRVDLPDGIERFLGWAMEAYQ